MLRVETGMHNDTIWRIGIDQKERYLVTGSDDKTVRLWDMKDGRLLKTLRLPIGMGDEGRIYAVAISPDGTMVAAGGRSGYEWDKAYSIYLFDRASGGMVKRLVGLPSVICHLAYSKDGSFLVATLVGENGIRVYRTSTWELINEDSRYGASSYGADFDEKGRLVTCCDDGCIRLYDSPFSRTPKVKVPGGKEPFSVRFSPNGTKIAVGFFNSTRVDVLSGANLNQLYSHDTTGVATAKLFAVSWSSNGKCLYAGGESPRPGTAFIRKWEGFGAGPAKDLPALSDTIWHVLPYSDGIAYGAADPAFGVFDGKDERVPFRGTEKADYRDNTSRLLLSQDGTDVQFTLKRSGGAPFRFSLTDRRLELDPKVRGDLSPPDITQLPIVDWKNENSPKLEVKPLPKPLPLEASEISRSLAIAPGGSQFLLGTDWYLRLFDNSGSEVKKNPVRSARAVNIAGKGKVAVAALMDGTIRWYRMSDLTEILAFFPAPDGQRWVAWTTPTGYYFASAGGEDLIGWHINQGKDKAAEFLPPSTFRSKRYRPDVVAKIITTLDEGEALRLANLEAVSAQPPGPIVQPQPVTGSMPSSPGATTTFSKKPSTPAPGLAAPLASQPSPAASPVTQTPSATSSSTSTSASSATPGSQSPSAASSGPGTGIAPPPGPPKIVTFRAQPPSIADGDPTKLIWDTKNATRVSILPDIGEVKLSGSKEVTPEQTKTYVITARNDAGQTDTFETKVEVKFPIMKEPPPQQLSYSFSIEPTPPPKHLTPAKVPRRMMLKWNAVKHAASYTVEVDCKGCCGVANKWCAELGKHFMKASSTKPEYTFEFKGPAQSGRWRVWALDQKGRLGKESGWQDFSIPR
jgi:WD domain, G-beta repeat